MAGCIAIVGVGLIGGSFALAMRKAGYTGRILGVSSPRTIETALKHNVIDEGVELEEAARQADLIYLSQPIAQILEAIPKLAGWIGPETLVTDAGSTKLEIVRCAEAHLPAGAFVGGHPMAGKESRGVESADAELFRGRTYILTAEKGERRAVYDWLIDTIQRFGCRIVTLSAEEHDRIVSYYSHVPQLASTALAAMIEKVEGNGRIAGPGLLDMTRLAMSSYGVWRDILETNGSSIRLALDDYIAFLQHLREVLTEPEMEQIFDAGARLAKSIRAESKFY